MEPSHILQAEKAATEVAPEITSIEEIKVATEEMRTKAKEEAKAPLIGCAVSSMNWKPCGNALASSSSRPQELGAR